MKRKCSEVETLFIVLIWPLPLLLFLFLFISSYRPFHWTYTVCECMRSRLRLYFCPLFACIRYVDACTVLRLHGINGIHVKYTAARTFCNEQTNEWTNQRTNGWGKQNKTKPNKKWRRINLEKEERFPFVRCNTYILCASCYNTHSCWLFILCSHFWTLNQEL